MEEDIKILREIQQGFSSYNDFMVMEAGERQIQAIQNLLTRYKQLEEENSKIEYVEKEIYKNNNPKDWDTKGLYTIKYHKRIDVIPKSKVKEKIEELKNCIKFATEENWHTERTKGAITILQELLEREGK